MVEVAAAINIVTLGCYPWESRMHYNNSSFEQRGQRFQLHTHVPTHADILWTAIIYYFIINSVYAFIKSTNMIYHNCVYQGAVNDLIKYANGTS